MSDDAILRLMDLPPLPAKFEPAATLMVESMVLGRARFSHPPTFIHTAGVPGSGKSWYLRRLDQISYRDGKPFALLIFDDIMSRMPGYKKAEQINAEAAFRAYEIPARIVTYRMLDALTAIGIHVMLEHSGANEKHLHLLKICAERGYSTELHYLKCNTEEAMKRVRDRNAQGQRFTPENLVPERQALLDTLLPQYEAIVDRFLVVDASEAAHRAQRPDARHGHPAAAAPYTRT